MGNRVRVIRLQSKATSNAPVVGGDTSRVVADGDEGEVKLIGVTEPARDAGVLHDHPYEAKGKVHDDGTLEFRGDTGPASHGREHGHPITAIMSDPTQTRYEFETEEADGGDAHKHVVAFDLDKPLGPQDEEGAEHDAEETEGDSGSNDMASPAPTPDDVVELGRWGETPNQYRRRLREPKDFLEDTLRTLTLKSAKGVQVIGGKLKQSPEGKSASFVAQSVHFNKADWTKDDAKTWLADHRDQFTKAAAGELGWTKDVEVLARVTVGDAPMPAPKPEGFPWIKKLAAIPQDGFGGLIFDDGAGFLALAGPDDPRRTFGDVESECLFAAPLGSTNDTIDAIAEMMRNGRPTVTLTHDGLLEHEIVRTGEFRHPKYKRVIFAKANLDRIVKNFDDGVTRQMVPVNRVHSYKKKGLGWVAGLPEPRTKKVRHYTRDGSVHEADGHSLVAHTRLNPLGIKEVVVEGAWSYSSAEVARNFRQSEIFVAPGAKPFVPQNKLDELVGPIEREDVLIGVALCNNPFLSAMDAFAATRPRHAGLIHKVIAAYNDDVRKAQAALVAEAKRRRLI